MKVIVGSIIIKDNKVLMVKERKKECFSKWSFPAGHLNENETVFEGAKRETLEETGCKVQLKKVFPIFTKNDEKLQVVMMHFLADLISEDSMYDSDEIMETKWLSIEEIKSMSEDEFRSYAIVEQILKDLENDDLYELNVINDLPNM